VRNQKVFFLITISALLIVIFFLSSIYSPEKISQVCFSESCFNVELAETPLERQRGLMGRESLKDESGMFFIFPESDFHGFWMKDTLISLDIIWMDENFSIIHIENSVEPCKTSKCPVFSPSRTSKYVLEINSGQAAKLNLKENQTAKIVHG
jgi:hypothetical protein